MELTTLDCPHCGASVELEDGLDVMYCKYCGAKLMVDGMSDGLLNAKVRLRELEHEERLADKKYEYKRFKFLAEAEDKYRSALIILAPMLLMFLMFIPISCSSSRDRDRMYKLEDEIVAAIEDGNYEVALAKANQLEAPSGSGTDTKKAWEEKRQTYIEMIQKHLDEQENGGESKENKNEDDDSGGWWPF